jgi:hypothetical protein
MAGALKAFLSWSYIPVCLTLTIPCLILWGRPIISQLILSGLGNILIVIIPVSLQKIELPFPSSSDMQQLGTNSLLEILSMVLLYIVAGGVYMTSLLPARVTFLICGLAAGSIAFLFSFVRDTDGKLD